MTLKTLRGATAVATLGSFMRPPRSVVLAIVAAVLLIHAPAVAAETVVDVGGVITETVTLDAGQWRTYRASMNSIESLHIVVRVVSGGLIDVFTTNDFGYGQYTDPNATIFSYYREGSQNNTASFSARFAAPTSGQYYAIVDNTRITRDGATPTGPVTVDVSLEKTSLLPFLAGVILGIAAVAIGIILFLGSRRRKRMAAPSIPSPPQPPSPPSPPSS